MANASTTTFKADISSLRQGIQQASREIRLANAEFKSASAGMDDWSKSADGLNAKINQTSKVLKGQKSILETYEKELELIKKEYGENSKQAQEMQIKIENQRAKVISTEKALSDYEKALDNVGQENEEVAQSVEASNEGFTVAKGVLADLVASGIKLAVSALKDLGNELADIVTDAAAYADEMNTLSAQTGLSTDRLQELAYMADLIDVDLSTIQGSMAKLTRNMSTAAKGTGDAAEAFKQLGINIKNEDGTLRNNQDVFNEVIDALGEMENETQRDAYAMNIFGKSAQDLNPIIKAGSGVLNDLSQEAHDMGYVLDTETLTSLNGLQDTFDRLNKVTEGSKNQIGAMFAPMVEEFLTPFIDIIKDAPRHLYDIKTALSDVDFEGVGKKVGEYMKQALDFIAYLVRNGNTVLSIVKGIGQALAIYFVANKVGAFAGVINF